MIGAYFTEDEHKKLVREAKRRGMTVAAVVREKIREYLNRIEK